LRLKQFSSFALKQIPPPRHREFFHFLELWCRRDLDRFGGPMQLKPEEAVRIQAELVWSGSENRKFGVTEHLNRFHSRKRGQVQFDRLRKSRQVCHTKDLIVLVASQVGENFPVPGLKEFDGAAAENLEQLSQGNHVAHPVQERARVVRLCFDVHGLV